MNTVQRARKRGTALHLIWLIPHSTYIYIYKKKCLQCGGQLERNGTRSPGGEISEWSCKCWNHSMFLNGVDFFLLHYLQRTSTPP